MNKYMTNHYKFVNRIVKLIKFMMIIYQNVFVKKELILLMVFVEHVIATAVTNTILQVKNVFGCVAQMKYLLMQHAYAKRDIIK